VGLGEGAKGNRDYAGPGPDYIDAIWALAEWYGVVAGNTDRGLVVLREADALDPFSAQVRVMRAWILMNGRRFDEAEAECGTLLDLERTNTSAALMRVSALALADWLERG